MTGFPAGDPQVRGPWPTSALVIGLGLSGRAAVSWLARQGCRVVVLEDNPDRAASAMAVITEGLVTLEVAPDRKRAAELARSVDLVVPSPGVPIAHPAVAAALAQGVPVGSEIELGWWLVEDRRRQAASRGESGSGLLVAVTGTNGKTTVTELVTAMLVASGVPAAAVGNVGTPLLEAAQAWSPGGDVLVTEVSSFQLEYTQSFAPDVSCWLNFAPDHLDWHPSLDHYRRAKARIWQNQKPGSTVVVNVDDAVVMAAAASVPAGAQVVGFGAGPLDDVAPVGRFWHVGEHVVEGPGGLVIKGADLPRAFPHDLENVAAAAAVAMAAGASAEGCLRAARTMALPPHRVQLVGERDGVAWYDDSKATTPAAVMAALAGLRSVVLLAGGRNKGLDLSVLARAVPPVRAVVAIGEAAAEVGQAFSPLVPTRTATSMDEAVQLAAGLARPGDAVLLSPGCASFDWYSSYAERGEHFTALVGRLLAAPGPSPQGPAQPSPRGQVPVQGTVMQPGRSALGPYGEAPDK